MLPYSYLRTLPRLLLLLLIVPMPICLVLAQDTTPEKNLWHITPRGSIVLHIDSSLALPHADHIEMSGKLCAGIISYSIDTDHRLSISKDVIFPQLRTYIKSDDPAWKKYRAYFRRTVDQDMAPRISCNQTLIAPSQIDSIEIDGMIRFHYTPTGGLQLSRTIYPAMDQRLIVEEWNVKNVSSESQAIAVAPLHHQVTEPGHRGRYDFLVHAESTPETNLAPGATYSFPVYHGALLEGEKKEDLDAAAARTSRTSFLDICRNHAVLETPDPVLNQLFYFSKIRAAESIYESSMGLVHSPGGGNYYVGIWANDQIEYSGPFFPYMGYDVGQQAAYDAYLVFLRNIPTDGGHIPYAFEVDGHYPMTHLDRGDAAMIAYGTSRFALSTGDIQIAKSLWPLIEWSLTYCHEHRNAAGAVLSESDEMEGRIETGDANLSTSTLYYGGLMYASDLSRSMGLSAKSETYSQRQTEMAQVIEQYFGADMDGLETYRYYDGNTDLRHWICLPLTMGIDARKDGTLEALFERLWTDDGVLVQLDPLEADDDQVFWDRATLYALRGALRVQETDLAMQKIRHYSTQRLLGNHVPYAIEAYPENDQRHLSAESALYCRIFIEGLLGVEPVSLSQISFTPSLPSDWDHIKMRSLYLFGQEVDVAVTRHRKRLRVELSTESGFTFDRKITPGESITIDIPHTAGIR